MRTSLSASLLSITLFASGAANSATVVQLAGSMNPGEQYTSTSLIEGLDVTVDVKKGQAPGKVYVVATFCFSGSGRWVGGINLSNSRPTTSFETLRVNAGGCSKASIGLESTSLYVYVHRESRD